MGLAKTERRAALGKVPIEIRRLMPADTVRMLLHGETPPVGFGLVGTQGVGKTLALAAIVKAGVADIVAGKIASLDRVPYDGEEPWRWAGSRWMWASWPTVAADLKAKVARDHGSDAVEDYVSRAANAPLLIIDDLGRERMRGTYSEDFSVGQLDRIIDLRSREERPLIWTSNASPRNLARIYGGAIVSRLVGLAPPALLPAMPDIRLGDQAVGA